MAITIKKGASKKDIQTLFKKLKKGKINKGFDASKFCGKIKFNEDALSIQKEMRDEWK